MSEIREIPLRNVILLIQDYLRTIIRRWYVVVAGALLGIAVALYLVLGAELNYQAPLTFALKENNQGAGIGVTSILGQIGLGGGSEYNLSKIVALASSQKIINDLLLDTISVDGVPDRTGNHIIQVYNLVEEWELEGATELTGDSISQLSLPERRLLKRLYSFTIESAALSRVTADEEIGLLTVSTSTLNEDLSLAISEELYERLSIFYTNESTGSSQASVARLQVKADSIKQALTTAEYQLANLVDRQQGIVQRQQLVRQAQLNRQVQMLSVVYGEVIRNLEAASFALGMETPFFQVVDRPFKPLGDDRANLVFTCILGGLLGAILLTVFVVLRKFYLDVMRNQGGDY